MHLSKNNPVRRSVVKQYGLWMKAVPRRRNNLIGAQWLKTMDDFLQEDSKADPRVKEDLVQSTQIQTLSSWQNLRSSCTELHGSPVSRRGPSLSYTIPELMDQEPLQLVEFKRKRLSSSVFVESSHVLTIPTAVGGMQGSVTKESLAAQQNVDSSGDTGAGNSAMLIQESKNLSSVGSGVQAHRST